MLLQERVIAALSAFFGGVGVVLVCIGLYGVIAYSTARRFTEIVCGSHFGATQARVLAVVVSESLLLVVAAGASLLPARRAASVDPVVALRCEDTRAHAAGST